MLDDSQTPTVSSRGPFGLGGWLAVVALTVTGFFACGGDDAEDDGGPEALCDPGTLTFCKCRGDRPGTRVCSDDGQGFEPCLADDGGECEEIIEDGTDTGVDPSLYSICANGEPCAEGLACRHGYCTKACAHFTECSPPVGDCVVAPEGDSICMVRCGQQTDCNTQFGGASVCSYAANVVPPASFGLAVCANWPEVVLPPDGFYCLEADAPSDLECNLGLEGAARICDANAGCKAGCNASKDCPAGTSCPAPNSQCEVGCTCGDDTCDTGCEDESSCPDDCGGLTVEGDKCPGLDVEVSVAGGTVIVEGDTSLAPPPSEAKGEGGCAPSSTATEEIIYGVTAKDDGMLLVLLEPAAGFDPQFYARSGSCTTGPQVACSDEIGVGVDEIFEFPVSAGQKYSLFVDGWSGSTGAFTLQMLLSER